MLVEKKLKEALIDYAKGRKVIVLQIYENGAMDPYDLDYFLDDENNHFLVDIPDDESLKPEQSAVEMDINSQEAAETPAPAQKPAETPNFSGGHRGACP